MGTVSRMPPHSLVAQRRASKRRGGLHRARHAPVVALSAGPSASATQAAAAEARSSELDMPLATLSWRDPFHWLALGWHDFAQAPWLGMLYGACFVAMGWALLGMFEFAPQYTLALSAGFLLMGPFLCLGLYQVSRRLQAGQPPRLLDSLTAWRVRSSQLAIFAAVLLVLEMLWGRAAMIVFAVSFSGIPDFTGPLSSFLTEEYLVFFTAYTVVGAIFAGLIYAISAISMPMILDREVDAISAGLTSARLVTTQSGVMLVWGGLITVLIGLAMLPGFLGLLVVGPVVGHASWHAYRAATASWH